MNDYLLAFADEAAAQADPVVGMFCLDDGAGGGSWNTSVAIPGVFAWDPAADTTETVLGPDGDFEQVMHHAYDNQWRILISLAEEAFIGHSALDIAGDRDTGQLLYSRLPDTLKLQPIFHGMEIYPFGDPDKLDVVERGKAPAAKRKR